MEQNGAKRKSFKEWLESDEELVVAEGYVIEFERRGYLSADYFIPEVVLEHSDLVKQAHEEFLHAGSDVVLAFTYNVNTKRLNMIDRAQAIERMHDISLATAKEVARGNGAYFASSISHSMCFSTDEEAEKEIRELYVDQVKWAKDSGVDFIVAETLGSLLEAKVAIELTKAAGIPIVVTFNMYRPSMKTHEGLSVIEACQKAEELGADVVGINCGRGPLSIIPILKELRAKCKGPLAALPACFRTTDKEPSWFQLTHPETGKNIYPKDLSMTQAPPSDIEAYAKACRDNNIRYIGLCCGNNGRLTSCLAETLGRNPPSSRYKYHDIPKEIKWLTT